MKATIIISIVILALCALALKRIVLNHKHGKNGCGGDCDACLSRGLCSDHNDSLSE